MPIYTTPDGRYTYAIETPNSGQDGNSVVYDHWRGDPPLGLPVWDRLSYEAGLGEGPVGPPSPTPNPQPQTPISGGPPRMQLTTPAEGDFVPRMYSYWANTWINGTTAFVFAGHVDGTPRLWLVDLRSGQVTPHSWPFPYRGTTEGWYWDASGWIYLIDGSRLRRVNPSTGADRVVFDIADVSPGCILWQAHSSDDGQTHSATVKRIVEDGAYPAMGTVVFRKGKPEYYPAQGDLDESQITPDGGWLIIKEDNDNRVINLSTRDTQILRDADGAVGHSDCGPHLLVGEDNIHGACVRWDLTQPLTPGRRVDLFATWNMGHLSIRGDRCLLSDDTHLSLVSLTGGGVVPLFAHGGETGDYDRQVKANLDPSGRIATYMIFKDGRYDVFLAVLP